MLKLSEELDPATAIMAASDGRSFKGHSPASRRGAAVVSAFGARAATCGGNGFRNIRPSGVTQTDRALFSESPSIEQSANTGLAATVRIIEAEARYPAVNSLAHDLRGPPIVCVVCGCDDLNVCVASLTGEACGWVRSFHDYKRPGGGPCTFCAEEAANIRAKHTAPVFGVPALQWVERRHFMA